MGGAGPSPAARKPSLLLWRDPRDGKTRIVFEELLLARPGWDESPRSEPPSLPAVARATTVEEMAATLGDESKLPAWKAATDAQAGMRALCMLRHDPERARALAELRLFFHPTRKARDVSLQIVQNDFPNHDDEGNVVEPEKPGDDEQRVIDEALGLLRPPVDHSTGSSTASIVQLDSPVPESLIDTTAFEARTQVVSDYQMIELFEENGHVYIDHLGTFHYAWNGCPW